MPGRDLGLVIPVFNEVSNIEPLVAGIGRALGDLDWEVIFVDDSSPDGTAEKVRRIAMDNERVRLILRVTDRGLAKSAIQGLLSSNAEVLCVMDGDGQHDPQIILELIAPIHDGTADITSASRRLEGSDAAQSLGERRTAISKLGNTICRLVLGREIADPLTGFFAIRRSSFVNLAKRLGDPGFKILLDILSVDRSLRHREIPFSLDPRRSGGSKLDIFVAWQFAVFILAKLTRGLVPPRFASFVIVGGFGILVHMALLLVLLQLQVPFAAAQFISAVGAASNNFVLNNVLTFREQRLRGSAVLPGLFKFLLVSLIGIFANVAIATLTLTHVTDFVLLAALAGIAMDTVWKYAISSRLVW